MSQLKQPLGESGGGHWESFLRGLVEQEFTSESYMTFFRGHRLAV